MGRNVTFGEELQRPAGGLPVGSLRMKMTSRPPLLALCIVATGCRATCSDAHLIYYCYDETFCDGLEKECVQRPW